MKIKRIFKIICLRIVTKIPLPVFLRIKFAKLGGVNIKIKKRGFIGEGVIFDSLYPELITIEDGAYVTMNCIILTHLLDTNNNGFGWTKGPIYIGERAFIGAGTLIVNSVSIGHHAVVGAGSVVTKDIPAGEIWAGNPAHFIKKRPGYENCNG